LRAKRPPHVQADVTVEVTAHGVKRDRPAGTGPARAPGAGRLGEWPAHRAGGRMPRERETCRLRESEQKAQRVGQGCCKARGNRAEK
jgi:hypothetical protein